MCITRSQCVRVCVCACSPSHQGQYMRMDNFDKWLQCNLTVTQCCPAHTANRLKWILCINCGVDICQFQFHLHSTIDGRIGFISVFLVKRWRQYAKKKHALTLHLRETNYTVMFVWTTLVLLFGVTLLGEIIDAENVIDGCGKSNSKMCGKPLILIAPTDAMTFWLYILHLHFQLINRIQQLWHNPRTPRQCEKIRCTGAPRWQSNGQP